MLNVIFGTGGYAQKYCPRVFEEYDIGFFCDNNKEKWGQFLYGKKIESPEMLKSLDPDSISVIILSMSFYEISVQLAEMGIKNICTIRNGRFFSLPFNDHGCFIRGENYIPDKLEIVKTNTIKKVLFIGSYNTSPLINRIHNYAIALKQHKILSFYAYVNSQYSDSRQEIPEVEGSFLIRDDVSFYNNIMDSDYDIIHILSGYYSASTFVFSLRETKKTIIYELLDYHPLLTLDNTSYDNDYIICANAAIRLADGIIFYNNPIKRYVINKLNLIDKKNLIFPAYASKKYLPSRRLSKCGDGEIHCVYAGGIGVNSHRDYRKIFEKMDRAGIHVHIFSKGFQETHSQYSKWAENLKFMHFYSELSYSNLINRLTEFDIGLVVYNFTPGNDLFLKTSLSCKVFDYLTAGLPLAVSNTELYSELVGKLGCGKAIDFEGDLKEQFQDIKRIKLDEDFCDKNNITMESNIERLINFYNEVKNNLIRETSLI